MSDDGGRRDPDRFGDVLVKRRAQMSVSWGACGEKTWRLTHYVAFPNKTDCWTTCNVDIMESQMYSEALIQVGSSKVEIADR